MIHVTITPCLLGYAVKAEDSAGPRMCPGVYEHFSALVVFLMLLPFDFVVRIG